MVTVQSGATAGQVDHPPEAPSLTAVTDLLADPRLGQFIVTELTVEDAPQAFESLRFFLQRSDPEDFLLVYFAVPIRVADYGSILLNFTDNTADGGPEQQLSMPALRAALSEAGTKKLR